MDLIKLMPVRTRITSILRNAIYSGEYKGGDELSLTDIASQLGISRTPIREAFQTLEAEGLITLRMNRGAIVNTIDRKFVQDVFEVRILMESEAAMRAAQNGMETETLLSRLYQMRDHFEVMNKEDYEALNQEIHMTIWNAADNQQLKKYLMQLWNGPSVRNRQNAAADHYKNSTFEHISILHFIRDGQPAEAKKAMEQHIYRSMNNILENFPE